MSTLYGARDRAWDGSGASDLYTIDTSTGAPTSVGNIGFAICGLAFDPTSGTLYGSVSPYSTANPKSLVTIDPATGVGTLIAAYSGGGGLGTFANLVIAFDSAGQLWAYEESSGTRKLYKIDKATAALTLIGTSSFSGPAPWGIEIDAADKMYGFRLPNDGDDFMTVNTTDASVGSLGQIQNGDAIGLSWYFSDAAFDGSGVMWVTGPDGSILTIDTDGNLTLFGTLGSLHVVEPGAFDGWAIAWDDEAKPDPWLGNPAYSPNTLLAARGSSYGTSDLYSVDPATGVLTSIGPIGYALTGMAQDPITGILYGITSNNSTLHPRSLITIDPTTGAGTFVAAESPNTPWTDIAFDSFGRLFAQGQSARFFLVDKATATGTRVGTHTGSTFGGALGISAEDVGYSAFNGSSTAQFLYAVNLNTGVYTAVALFNGAGVGGSGWAMPAAGFDGADVFWAVDGASPGGPVIMNLVTVDVVTATVTIIAAFSLDGVDALCWAEIAGPADNDFSVDLTPPALTIPRGSSDTTALSTTITSGVAQSITLSDTGDPTGVSLAYAANPIMSGGGTTVTVTVTGAATPGIYPIVIHAVGTDATHVVTLTLTIPGPIDDHYNALENRTLHVAAPGVMSNDIDPTTVSLVSGPSHGALTLNPDGSFDYTPDLGYLGSDSLVYAGNGGTATVTLTIAALDAKGIFGGGAAFPI